MYRLNLDLDTKLSFNLLFCRSMRKCSAKEYMESPIVFVEILTLLEVMCGQRTLNQEFTLVKDEYDMR
jgi:hypothetical protein